MGTVGGSGDGVTQPRERAALVRARCAHGFNGHSDAGTGADGDFRRALEGRHTRLVPWLQDFSLGRTYTLQDVRDQIFAARAYHTDGFLLWNPLGVYTPGALH